MVIATRYKPYPKYKPSGIDWLGDIPEEWGSRKLKYIGYKMPKTKNQASDGLLEGKYPFFTSSQIISNYINLANFDGEFLIFGTGGEASLHYFNGPFSVTADCLVFKSGYEAYGKYTYYFLLGHKEIISDLGFRGMGLEHLEKDFLFNFTAFLPPKTEQQRIIDFLDRETVRIDEVVAKKQKLIELLLEKRQAVISQAVTKGLNPKAKMKNSGISWLVEIPESWEVKEIKHVAKIVLGKMLQNEDQGNDELKPYLRAQNILWEKVDTTDVKEMWLSDYEQKQYRVEIGDLLVSEGGEVGRTAIWNSEISECYIQNSVHKVTVNNRMNNYYLLCLLETYGKNGYLDSIVNRVSIGHLTREKLKEVEILVPSKDEQKEIADYINKKASEIDELIRMIKLQNQKLQEFRQVLISNVVTGKVKVS